MGAGIRGKTANSIAESVRGLIVRGHLKPGESLPPIRALAADLGVNRNTVAAAYRLIVAAGAAETHRRGGTVITALPNQEAELLPAAGAIDLASGNPDPRLLPDVRAAIAAAPYQDVLYNAPAIDPTLRDAAHRLFGGDATSGKLAITHGAVDAVERVLNTHLIRGDVVALENPCFLASIGTLRINGFRTAAVPVDEHGMTPHGLDQALRRGARAVIVTPRAHNPTGVTLTAKRAHELHEVLREYPEVLVIEDDHFSMVSAHRYHRITPDTTRRWALIRSVAKFLGPDLRIALVYSDESTANSIGARLRSGKTWVSHLLQAATAQLLTDPVAMNLVRTARATYQQRTRILTKELRAHSLTALGNPDGLNVWIDVAAETDTNMIHAQLTHAGWAVQPGHIFAVNGAERRNGIRVTTSTLEASAAQAFARTLASIL
jgi:DNA-binding transcriptional MocR family regulator